MQQEVKVTASLTIFVPNVSCSMYIITLYLFYETLNIGNILYITETWTAATTSHKMQINVYY